MAYKIGHCTQCDVSTHVFSADGRLQGIKPNAGQGWIIFNDGKRLKVNICKDCAASPDVVVMLNNLVAAGSRAGSGSVEWLKSAREGQEASFQSFKTYYENGRDPISGR